MKGIIEFSSDMFPADADEERKINPGRHGRRLAKFLVQELEKRDIHAGPPIAEDWGWLVPIPNEIANVWVGCGNIDDEDGRYMLHVEPSETHIRRWFRKIDVQPVTRPLNAALLDILSSTPGITDVDLPGEYASASYPSEEKVIVKVSE